MRDLASPKQSQCAVERHGCRTLGCRPLSSPAVAERGARAPGLMAALRCPCVSALLLMPPQWPLGLIAASLAGLERFAPAIGLAQTSLERDSDSGRSQPIQSANNSLS
jgi:hypothetical protein